MPEKICQLNTHELSNPPRWELYCPLAEKHREARTPGSGIRLEALETLEEAKADYQNYVCPSCPEKSNLRG